MDIPRRTTGVYCILNTVNGRRYVGSSAVCISERWRHHREELRNGVHRNTVLQRAWAKHGEDAFSFVVLEICGPEQCVSREQHWMDTLSSHVTKGGYNLDPNAGSRLGTTHTDATKKKISDQFKGKKRPPDFGAKISASRLASDYKVGPETRAKLSRANSGKVMSKEARAKMSAAKKGIKLSEELKVKRAESMKAVWASGKRSRSMSKETRQKISDAHKGRKFSPEVIARRIATRKLKGYTHSLETRAKISRRHMGKPKPRRRNNQRCLPGMET